MATTKTRRPQRSKRERDIVRNTNPDDLATLLAKLRGER